MLFLYILLIPIIYITIKIILYFIISKFGKFAYDGFSALGFAYNSEKDMFYSTKNAWQKNFGYCHLYDVGAPIFRMIIDTEPIKFHYNNKNWLITFWKGQYGIVTGAEIGIYTTKEQKVNKKTLYFPAKEDEMLNMSFILYKKGKEIMRVKAKHWWLAIFKLGMFTNPKDLTMDIRITFPNYEMLNAFIKSFKKLRYTEKKFKIVDCTFCFTYKHPRSKKVWTRFWLADRITQFFNRKNVKLYNKYLSDVIDNDGIDDSKNKDKKLIMINKMIPNILKNNPEKEGVIEKKTDKNVIFLNDAVYSKIKRDDYD